MTRLHANRGERALLRMLALMLCALLAACQSDDAEDDEEEDDDDGQPAARCEDAGTEVVIARLEDVCSLQAGPFTLEIDNPFLPLAVGSVHVMEGEEDGAALSVTRTVLDETEQVGGVTTRVLQEREEEEGEVVEISRNFIAQAADGSVCYFGEDVDIYEGGEIVAHEGAWRAGSGDAQPGILMPAEPELGMTYAQEIAVDMDAWDHASHVAEGASITVPAGTYDDTIQTIEWTPIEPLDISRKAYARGVGMIVDDVVTLATTD
jgi:hypothetical protein